MVILFCYGGMVGVVGGDVGLILGLVLSFGLGVVVFGDLSFGSMGWM